MSRTLQKGQDTTGEERPRSCPRLEETKETGQLSGMWDPGLEPRTVKEPSVSGTGDKTCGTLSLWQEGAWFSLSYPHAVQILSFFTCATVGKQLGSTEVEDQISGEPFYCPSCFHNADWQRAKSSL